MKKGKKYGIVIVFILLIGLLILLWCLYEKRQPEISGQKQAGSFYGMNFTKYVPPLSLPVWNELEGSKYDSLLLTSYRCRQFDLDVLSWGFGVKPLQVVWQTGSTYEVKEILEQSFENIDDIGTVFMELDPRQHNSNELMQLFWSHKETEFYVFFSPYPSKYWSKLEAQDALKERQKQYRIWEERLLKLEHVKLFYFDDQEWMANNPNFFADAKSLHKDALFQIYAAMGIGHCKLTEEEQNELYPITKEPVYEDFSGQVIFCLGDSMLGKDRNGSGAAEVAAGFLNAKVYNAAIGGSSAAGAELSDLSQMVDILLSWESYAEKIGTERWQEQIPLEVALILEQMQAVTPDYIILAYGYNDYSEGTPPYVQNGMNAVSFEEALRQNIKRLKITYPQAKIIVSTAVSSSMDLGMDYVLEDYAMAARQAAEKEQVYCLYNYEVDELISSNLENILSDGVHFNVAGRFLQGKRIAAFLEKIGEPKVSETE